jgi:hypothetical protein
MVVQIDEQVYSRALAGVFLFNRVPGVLYVVNKTRWRIHAALYIDERNMSFQDAMYHTQYLSPLEQIFSIPGVV